MDRPTLLMIHGLVGSLHYFDPQARMPGVSVVTEDLLGYGRHVDVPPDRLTLGAQADHVIRLIDGLLDEKLWLLGHSMGGAVAVLAADRRAERVCGIINVEGNFTEKDTFWSRKIAARQPDEWAEEYRTMQGDLPGWLDRCGVAPDPQRVVWAEHLLTNQPASTVYAMAKALIDETLCSTYLDTVRRLLDRGVPCPRSHCVSSGSIKKPGHSRAVTTTGPQRGHAMHLVAGAKSAAEWGVPDFVRKAAASYTEQPDVGHLMMLEAPDEFCGIIASILVGKEAET